MAMSSTGKNKDLVFLGNAFESSFGLKELLSSPAEALGEGTFGYTYKVDLEGKDAAVAVKRLKVVSVSEGEFAVKVETLARFVHENLLPLRAYHCHMNVRRLIYDYMPMGNLSSVLHGSEEKEKTPISWEFRTNIAYDIALGIEYIHSHGSNAYHGNIRSSNVFLTNFFHAQLSEFGVAQLASPKPKTSLNRGYCAPEVKNLLEISAKADVYSFGVLLLELLTGLSPRNRVSKYESCVDLAKWVRLMFQEKPILDVFDVELLKYENDEEQMVQMLELAICCTFEYSQNRPVMSQVTRRIREICNF